jgi:ABC-type nickel/cobalt efflux system permease component RcnA
VLQDKIVLTATTLLLMCCVLAAAHAQPLPMPQAAPAGDGDMTWWGSLVAWLQQVQGDLWRTLAKAVRAVKEEGSISALSWLLGLSFFYGVVHAAGPGHGKAIISAYLVGNESAVRRGILLSFLSAAAQGVTAILLVGILAALFGFISREVAGTATWLETASALMIIGIGAWLVTRTLQALWLARTGHHAHAHGHHHHDEHGHGHHHGCAHQGHDHDHAHHGHAHAVVAPDQAKSLREGLAIVAAIGARPCMGAIFVLLFSLAQGVFFFGVLATMAMSLGTAITVGVLAVLASGARATALKVAGSMDGWMLITTHALSIVGGTILVLLGFALLWQPSSPFPGAG